MKYLEDENFDELISSGLHLVDFYADWCGPCKMLGPVLEEIASEIDIIKVNVDAHNELAQKYKVMSIPTIIFFKDGKAVKETIGFKEKDELLNIIKTFK